MHRTTNPTHMVPTALAIANDLQLLQSHYLTAQLANRTFDVVAGRIRQQHGMWLRLEQILAISNLPSRPRHFTHA